MGDQLPQGISVDRRPALVAAILAGAGVVLGGGGSPAPVPEIMLQCLAALLFAAWILVSPSPRPFADADRSAWTIAALILALPLIQLIPLPPFVWHALPGRSLEQASLALIGEQLSWRPWSLVPSRTFAALLVLLPAVALMMMTACLQRGGRSLVVTAITAMAALALLAGAGQMAGGEGNAFRFYARDVGYLNGFQANHNSAADVLMIAMVGAVAAIRDYCETHRHTRLTGAYRLGLVAVVCLLFAIGVILTASRAGIMLLPVALLGVLILIWPWLRFDRRSLAIAGAVLLALVILGGWIAANNHVVERVMTRFAFGEEFRPQLWRDSLYALKQYFPFGAGIGAFVPVFLAVERLEVVDTTLPNRAHNELLELGVETGVFGVMVLAVIASILAKLMVKVWKAPAGGSRAQLIFATTALSVIALHSQVDYPLRSMSLAFIAAVCVGLLLPVPGWGDPKGDHD